MAQSVLAAHSTAQRALRALVPVAESLLQLEYSLLPENNHVTSGLIEGNSPVTNF